MKLYDLLTDMFSVGKKHSWDVLQFRSTMIQSNDIVLNRKGLHKSFLCPMHVWFLWQCVSLFILCVSHACTVPYLCVLACRLHMAVVWQCPSAYFVCPMHVLYHNSHTFVCPIHAAYLWWSVSLCILCVSFACTTPYLTYPSVSQTCILPVMTCVPAFSLRVPCMQPTCGGVPHVHTLCPMHILYPAIPVCPIHVCCLQWCMSMCIPPCLMHAPTYGMKCVPVCLPVSPVSDWCLSANKGLGWLQ